jgi:hypothetical protein
MIHCSSRFGRSLAVLVVCLSSIWSCRGFPGASLVKNGVIRAAAAPTTSLKASSTSSSPQVLEFQEPTTGVTVKLVGCMHYNPASIQLTEDVINDLARDNKLGSVVIESCDIRWNQTNALPKRIQQLLQSEMKAASELASQTYQVPVVLGDQRINITLASLKRGCQETVADLFMPWNGGWYRLWSNITAAREEALPFGDPYLNAFAFLDPKLLLASPVSFIKYPLSYFFKAPLRTTVALTGLFLLNAEADATMVTVDQMTVGDWAGSLTVSLLEIALFGRVFLKELLADRNVLLARNILEQCKLYQATSNRNAQKAYTTTGRLSSLWSTLGQSSSPSSNMDSSNDQQDKAVVAVLGMAHCNGIMKLLKEKRV